VGALVSLQQMSSRVPVLDLAAIEGMHTGSLLTRLQNLQQCEECFNRSDRFGLEDEPDAEVTGYIEFKDSPAWIAAYNEVKEILANREHMPTAAEREARRKNRGK